MPAGTAHHLAFGMDGRKDVRLLSVTGAAERAAGGDAQALLRALMGPDADALTLGDRDRLLAELHGDLYGWNVLADTRCTGCGAGFEMRFSLRALMEARQPDGSAPSGVVTVGDAQLRLPAVGDLAASPEALVAKLTVAGDPPPLVEAEAALEAADPAIEVDLSGTCPDCGVAQPVPFSMRGFFGAALARDLRFLMREVHLLARSYGWSLDSILSLTRAERQDLVRLILSDGASGAGRRAS